MAVQQPYKDRAIKHSSPTPTSERRYSTHPLNCNPINPITIRNPAVIQMQFVHATAGEYRTRSEADSGNKEKPSSHPTRSQTTRGRYTRGRKAQDAKTGTSRQILQSIPSHSTAVCHMSTESHQSTILNPAAIPPQFVHMTAGEYRTSRGDDRPVNSN